MSALSIVSGFWMSRARANALLRISILEAQMSSRKAEVDRLKKEDEEKQQQEAKIFLSEQDSYHLAAARQLIMRRSFAWDKLVGDLERFVPKNARLVAIKISGITKGDSGVTASLELSALGKSPAEMTEMMTQFGKSEGLFEVGDAQQGEVTDTGETPFSLGLQYHPRRGGDQ